jgi:hypothetical protein
VKGELLASEAALLANKQELASARSSLVVARGVGLGEAAASAPPALVAMAPGALYPSASGVTAGINPTSTAPMVRSGVSTTECVRARTAILEEWEYWSHFSN